MTNILGDKIRKLRKEKGLTLDELATLTGSSKSYIWELENKNPPRPSAEKLSKIAEKLETTIEYLLDKGKNVHVDDAKDARFFRDYQAMKPSEKEKFREMVKIWKKS